MRTVLLILSIIIATNGIAQKIALLDTKLIKPILFTDSITVQGCISNCRTKKL